MNPFRGALARSAVSSGVTSLFRRRNAAPIFGFHNVVPDHMAAGRGDRSLHMGVTNFHDVITVLSSLYEFIPLPVLADRIRRNESIRGLAAVTFDDAYEGVFRHALPVLRMKNLPSTIFVVTQAAAEPFAFWWDLLSDAIPMTSQVRETSIMRCSGITSEVLASNKSRSQQRIPLPPEWQPADWETIRAHESDSVSIGSHTARHANLTSLSPEMLAVELSQSRESVLAQCNCPTNIISYPYGLSNQAVLSAAQAAGYDAGVLLTGKNANPGADLIALPRVSVPAGITPEAAECRAAGLR